MKKILLGGILLLLTATNIAQTCSTAGIVELDSVIRESSGLIYFDGKLVTHNDSGDGAFLYEIDTTTGNVARTVTISNASNVDWEDITQDNDYIYVGDFGNNSGSRSDLIIYKVAKSDFNTQTSITADSIQFQYATQIDFTPNPNATNYDCEAMTCIGDSLILFSKNWENNKTYTYLLPKNAGFYNLEIRDSLDTQGTVTGATYNTNTQSILLVGYDGANPFMWELAQFSNYDVLQGINTRCGLTQTGSMQIEAIAVKGDFDYFLSSEKVTYGNFTLAPYLSSYTKGGVSIAEYKKVSFELFPNPVNKYLTLVVRSLSAYVKQKIRITNTLGEIIFETTENVSDSYQIDTSLFPNGLYYISIINNEGVTTQSFIKN